jgi:phosphonate transport system ATP-binding protein
MLKFDELDVRYGQRAHALQSVSFSVPRGQFCVLLGSSGAGKSSLLRAVNGLVTSSAGGVWVDGLRVGESTLRQVRSRVSMIHQQLNLIPRLDVLSNVLTGALAQVPLWAALVGLFPREYRRKACELLNEVGLGEEFLYRRAAQLSGGEQQRVAIARAFILEPSVVLADEPIASLDPRIAGGILRLLKQASRRHETTVLCSLHQLELAREFADRIIGISHGRVVYDGAPAGLHDAVLRRIYVGADGAPAGAVERRPAERFAPATAALDAVGSDV